MTTFVYQDTEVKLTGKQAVKKYTDETARRQIQRVDVKVEITPLDETVGTWKKWVKYNDLYEVNENDEIS